MENYKREGDIGSLYVLMNKRIQDVRVGAAITQSAIYEIDRMNLVSKHFNSMTCENEMKPEYILGKIPDIGIDGYPILDFTNADEMASKIIEMNMLNNTNIKIRGHVLVWHSQTPEWFFYENYDVTGKLATKEIMLLREENYIRQVLDHYHSMNSKFKNLIYAWDVVNEAIDDNTGELRTKGYDEKVTWYNIFKDDITFVTQAFVYANKYAPKDVKLFYNDFNEYIEVKCNGICKLLSKIKETPGARINGMGMQCHYTLKEPEIKEFHKVACAYSKIVDEIQLTEIDIKASEDFDENNIDKEYREQANRYKSLSDEILKLTEEGVKVTAITFWGTDDGNSWLNYININGGGSVKTKRQCPLLFDEKYQAKPAYFSFTQS